MVLQCKMQDNNMACIHCTKSSLRSKLIRNLKKRTFWGAEWESKSVLHGESIRTDPASELHYSLNHVLGTRYNYWCNFGKCHTLLEVSPDSEDAGHEQEAYALLNGNGRYWQHYQTIDRHLDPRKPLSVKLNGTDRNSVAWTWERIHGWYRRQLMRLC